VVSASAHYSEAGAFTLALEDTTFASVDTADTALAIRTVPQASALQVGRFVPDHFAFTGANTPQFQTFNASCAAARSFTYIGQPFWYVTGQLPTATVQAVNTNGAVTTNYRGALFKLTGASIIETYADAGTPATAPAIDPSSPLGTSTLGTGNGTASYSADPTGTLAYSRSTTAVIPANHSPFNANISLTVNATDTSEIAIAGNPGNALTASAPLTSTTPLVFSNIAFDSGNLFRYGRLRMSGATGSELLPLPIAIQTEYWTGTGFTLNSADNCTTLASSNVALTYSPTAPLPLAACNTFVNTTPITIASGTSLTMLAAPGGNAGSVNLSPQLGGTASGQYCTAAGGAGLLANTVPASKSYLQGAWAGVSTYDQNPIARAAFGVYGAQPRNFIFFRENY
jgi:hypothetical protein